MRFLAFVSLLVVGCGPADPCPTHTQTFSQIRQGIFKTSCNFSSCHSASANPQGGLDLETDPYAALLGVMPAKVGAAMRGWKRVTPGSEATSFLYQKLVLPVNNDPQLGLRMPNTGQTLDGDSIAQIQCWIHRGAPKD